MDLSEQAGVPVGIIMGSQSDWATMREAAAILKELGTPCLIHQPDEIGRCVSCQRTGRESRILRQEPVRRRRKIGEIASSAARDANLLARPRRMLDHHGAQSAPDRLAGTEQPSRPGPQNDHIRLIHAPAITAAQLFGKTTDFRLAAPRALG